MIVMLILMMLSNSDRRGVGELQLVPRTEHDCGRSFESCFCAEEYIDRLPATEIDDARDWRPWPNNPKDERDWVEWHRAKRAREEGRK